MLLYHVTPKANVRSILKWGLLASMARSPSRKAVWGVSRSLVPWAIVHVLGKAWYMGRLGVGDVVVVQWTLPRSKVRRYGRGVWYTGPDTRSIPITQTAITPAEEYGK